MRDENKNVGERNFKRKRSEKGIFLKLKTRKFQRRGRGGERSRDRVGEEEKIAREEDKLPWRSPHPGGDVALPIKYPLSSPQMDQNIPK